MDQRLPARVYRVRRVVFLLAVLVVVGVLVGVVAGVRALLGGGDAAPSAASSPRTTSVAAAPTSTLPGGIADCAPASLALTIAATAPSYAAGVSPGFTLTITNTGSVPCLVDSGDTHRAIVVTSGTDRIWSNQDCAAADADARTLLLAAGRSDSQTLAWNLVRSAAGCPDGLPTPGPGTYQASFAVGGAQAAPVSFVLAEQAPAPTTEASTPAAS